MQLRASVSQFLYPLSKPETYESGTYAILQFHSHLANSVAHSFAEQAQISNDLLRIFSINHRRHKGIPFRGNAVEYLGIFDFVNEKYEANPKGLLRFRAPTAEEKALTITLPPPGRADTVVSAPANPPPPIEYFENGLDDLAEINRVWDEFQTDHEELKCVRISNTEFQVQIRRI